MCGMHFWLTSSSSFQKIYCYKVFNNIYEKLRMCDMELRKWAWNSTNKIKIFPNFLIRIFFFSSNLIIFKCGNKILIILLWYNFHLITAKHFDNLTFHPARRLKFYNKYEIYFQKI